VVLAVVAGLLLVSMGAVAAFVLNGDDETAEPDGLISADGGASSTTAATDQPESGDGSTSVVAPVEGADGDPLIIATMIDEGEFARDEDQVVAIDLAATDIGEAGGVLGQPLVVLHGGYQDDASMVANSIDLLNEGATAIIGPSDPVDTKNAISTVTGRGAILMSPTDFFSRADDTGLYFQTRIPSTLIGEAAVSILDPDLKSVALVYPSEPSPSDEQMLATLRAAIDQLGFALTEVEVVKDGERAGEAAAAAEQVAAADPGAVLLFGFIKLEALYIALANAGVGPLDLPYVAVADDGVALDLPDGAVTGVRGVNVDFLTGQALEERVPASDFSHAASQAYDAVIILALAAEHAGSTSAEAMAEALPLVTGGGEVCTFYAECRELITKGVDIDYVGPGGTYVLSAEDGRPSAGYFQLSVLGDNGLIETRTRLVFVRPQ
jgi:branched-chain amino acid transport system substrate-binding protein